MIDDHLAGGLIRPSGLVSCLIVKEERWIVQS
jgi:hypothetical protein